MVLLRDPWRWYDFAVLADRHFMAGIVFVKVAIYDDGNLSTDDPQLRHMRSTALCSPDSKSRISCKNCLCNLLAAAFLLWDNDISNGPEAERSVDRSSNSNPCVRSSRPFCSRSADPSPFLPPAAVEGEESNRSTRRIASHARIWYPCPEDLDRCELRLNNFPRT